MFPVKHNSSEDTAMEKCTNYTSSVQTISAWWLAPRETVTFVSPRPSRPLLFPPNSKIQKKKRRHRLLDVVWLTNLPPFQGARPDQVRVESSSFCFPRELLTYVRPRELVSFDLRHATQSPPIGKRIWVGRYNKNYWLWRWLPLKLWKNISHQQQLISELPSPGRSHYTSQCINP